MIKWPTTSRNFAAITIMSIALTGCISDGDDGTEGATGPIPLITSISFDEDDNALISIVTDETVDLRLSTDPDCDWGNVELCDDGRFVPHVSSEVVELDITAPFEPNTQWFIKAGKNTSRAQTATFFTPDKASVLFFGNEANPAELIRTNLKPVNDEVILEVERAPLSAGPAGLAADSENNWLYFSYEHADDGNVIDRVREDGSEQERVITDTTRLVRFMEVDPANEVLYTSSGDFFRVVDISSGDNFGEIDTLPAYPGATGYGDIAWNPHTENLLALSSDPDSDSGGCRLSTITPVGDATELAREESKFCDTSTPMALDIENQVLYFEFGDPNNLKQKDLNDGTISDLSLESYDSDGMTIDSINRDLYYQGSSNTVRRQNLDDPSDNEVVLDVGAPTFSASAAILRVPQH